MDTQASALGIGFKRDAGKDDGLYMIIVTHQKIEHTRYHSSIIMMIVVTILTKVVEDIHVERNTFCT